MLARDPLAALFTHSLERAHASFVAGAPRLDALPDPALFLRELPVEQLVPPRLVLERFALVRVA